MIKVNLSIITLLLSFCCVNASAQKMHFDFSQVDGKNVTCSAGSGVIAKMMNTASVVNMGNMKVLYLGNGNGYLDLTSDAGNIFASSDDYTISMYYYVEPKASLEGAGYFLWSFSTNQACSSNSGVYAAYRLNAQRFAFSSGGWNNEKGIQVGTPSSKGVWKHVACRVRYGSGALYIDGQLVGSNWMDKNTVNFKSSNPQYCWIGRAPFSSDNYLNGTYIADIKVYGYGLTNDEISSLAAKTSDIQRQMDFGTAGNDSILRADIQAGENFINLESANYSNEALLTFQDVLRGAKCIVESNASQSMLDTWAEKLSSSLAALKLKKGYTFVTPNINEGYDTNRGFVHPGCINTQEEIDRVKARLAAKGSIILAAYAKLISNQWASSAIAPSPTETIVRGGAGENYINAARQAHTAYLNALQWRITGNTANAECAVRILNAWARTCKLVTGDTNYALAAGIYGYEFANAAEMLRDYRGWLAEDFKSYKQWMLDVWYSSSIGFLRGRNGTWENVGKWWQAPGHYWSNWGLCNGLCVQSIGVLCDDPFIYNQALSFYKYDQCDTFKDLTPSDVASGDGYIWSWGLTEFIGNLVPIVNNTPDSLMSTPWGKMSQMQESGRDQGHCTLSIGFTTDICQTALNQGDDLYAFMDNRLAGGIEHMAAFNYAGKDNLPFVKYIRQSDGFTVADGRGGIMTGDSFSSRGLLRPYWDRILGYYEGRKGITMPYSEIARKMNGIDGGGSGSTSGGYDHLGYSTLMCNTPMVSKDSAILTLVPSIIYAGKTYNQNELGGLRNTYQTNNKTCLPVGSELTLTAALPEGTQADGTWRWDTGETTPSINVLANASRIYRVCYTARNGVKSQQNFVVAIDGDCQPTSIKTTMVSDGADINGNSAIVFFGSPASMSISSGSAWGTAYWSEGTQKEVLDLPCVTSNRSLTGVYVNQGGRKQKVMFDLKVKYLRPDITVNGKLLTNTTSVMVSQGDSIVLTPYVPEMIRNLMSYTWDDGSTTRELNLAKVNNSQVRTLTCKFDDYTESFTYNVQLNSGTNIDNPCLNRTFDTGAVYDLSGRKVAASIAQISTLRKGVYIVNGQKVLK